MKNDLKKVLEYIKSDCVRYAVTPSIFKILTTLFVVGDHCLRYSIWFRLSSRKNIFRVPAKLMRRRYAIKYGIQIPSSTSIGYGLYIGHGVGVVVNPTAVIGNNCNLSQFVTIGSNHNQAAIIGNNVSIGPSVCIVEHVKIGNNVTIGAGAVVVKDIPDGATAAGVPAKVISYNDPGRYIIHPWQKQTD
ncbi:MAG: serine acetyltransferase [Bacteroidota bacterium]